MRLGLKYGPTMMMTGSRGRWLAVLAVAALLILGLGLVFLRGPVGPVAEDAQPNARQQDPDFAFRLGLLSGHLRVGRELIAAGQTRDALPHFGHPVRELYGDLRPVLAQRGLRQFDGDLIRLEALAASQPNSPAFSTLFAEVTGEVDAARNTIPVSTRESQPFVLAQAANLASAAGQEYRNAFIAGRIGSAVEYHDARGFIFFAASLVRAQAQRGDTAQVRDVMTVLSELQRDVAPLNPPEPPVATPDVFDRAVGRLHPYQGGVDRAARQGLS